MRTYVDNDSADWHFPQIQCLANAIEGLADDTLLAACRIPCLNYALLVLLRVQHVGALIQGNEAKYHR